MDMSMSMSNSSDMGGMKMYFHFGVHEDILFYTCDSPGEMVGSCFFVAIMAILFEMVKMFRMVLEEKRSCECPHCSSKEKSNRDGHETMACCNEENGGSSIRLEECKCSKRPLNSPFHVSHLIQTATYFVQVCLAYLVMLAAMTYNVWICIAAVLGFAIGYFMVGWRKQPGSGEEETGCH